MFTLLQKLSFFADYLIGRYEVLINDPASKAEGYQLLYRVFEEELQHVGELALDKEVHENHILMTCRDKLTGQIVACSQATEARFLVHNLEYERLYQFSQFPKEILEKTIVADRFAILPTYRKTGLYFLLFHEMTKFAYRQNYIFSLSVCDPLLYHYYSYLGARPFRPILSSPFGGYYLPLYFFFHDVEHLRKSRSFLWPLAWKQMRQHPPKPLPQHIQTWLNDFILKTARLETGIFILRSEDPRLQQVPFFQELTAKGIHQLCQHAIFLHLRSGEKVISQGDGTKAIFFVAKGSLEARKKTGETFLLQTGDMFGGFCYLYGGLQPCDVISLSLDCELIIVSFSAIQGLTKPKDMMLLWQHLAKSAVREHFPVGITSPLR